MTLHTTDLDKWCEASMLTSNFPVISQKKQFMWEVAHKNQIRKCVYESTHVHTHAREARITTAIFKQYFSKEAQFTNILHGKTLKEAWPSKSSIVYKTVF